MGLGLGQGLGQGLGLGFGLGLGSRVRVITQPVSTWLRQERAAEERVCGRRRRRAWRLLQHLQPVLHLCEQLGLGIGLGLGSGPWSPFST